METTKKDTKVTKKDMMRSASKRIGANLFRYDYRLMQLNAEFIKITLVAEDESTFSVMYPLMKTDFLRPDHPMIDPAKRSRIKKIVGYHLMPNPKLATQVRESFYWRGMFDYDDNAGVPLSLIANAKEVILEGYDVNDTLLKERFVWRKRWRDVIKQYLHNWPFDPSSGEVVGEFDWRREEKSESA